MYFPSKYGDPTLTYENDQKGVFLLAFTKESNVLDLQGHHFCSCVLLSQFYI